MLFSGLLLFELAVAKSVVILELQCSGRVAVDLNLAFSEPLLYLPDHGLELNKSLAQRRAGTLKSVIDQVLADSLISMSRLTNSDLWLQKALMSRESSRILCAALLQVV